MLTDFTNAHPHFANFFMAALMCSKAMCFDKSHSSGNYFGKLIRDGLPSGVTVLSGDDPVAKEIGGRFFWFFAAICVRSNRNKVSKLSLLMKGS